MARTSTARQRLVESAMQLIHASSYATASVDDLCTAAEVNKGSFYHFFQSKRDLTLAAIDQQWINTREQILEPAFAPDIPPLDRIERFFRIVAARQSRPIVLGCPFGNLAVELSTLDSTIRDRVNQVFEGFRSYFEQALCEAQADSSICIPDPKSSSYAVLALFQGAILLAKTQNDPGIISRLAGQAADLACPRVSSEQAMAGAL